MPGTTGLGPLPDTGKLQYNGVTWSALYKSKLDGKVVIDASQRITRYMQWELQVDGIVTLEQGLPNTDQTWAFIRKSLSVDGADLVYTGQGFGGLQVGPGQPTQDVAWGPIPEVLSFQPLGQARSAFIAWRCVVRIPELSTTPNTVVQFSYESALSYDEEGYATVSLRGTLEIALARAGLPGAANNRVVTQTVDKFRQLWLDIDFDLTKYKIVRREFPMTRDKRTCEWEYQATELAPFGLPLGHTGAHGTMSFRPIRPGGGQQGKLLAVPRWVCSMKCTYAVRSDFPRRMAQFAFLSLLWYRMWSSLNGSFPVGNQNDVNANANLRGLLRQPFKQAAAGVPVPALPNVPIGTAGALKFYQQLAANQKQVATALIPVIAINAAANPLAGVLTATAMLMDFGFDEGLYEDSKTVTFQAAWSFFSTFETVMQASGVWNYSQDVGGNVWSTSVKDIMGWRGPLAAQIDPSVEVLVDMGGGAPLSGPVIVAE